MPFTPEQQEAIRHIVRQQLEEFLASDRYIFSRRIQILEGRDVQLGTSTGTKIGTATSQKLGFFNATPVVRQTAPASLTETGIDSDATARAAVNSLRTALINLGLIA